MSTHAKLLSSVFDEKVVKLLQSLLLKEEIFYLRDLSRETGVSLATTHRIVQKLLKMGLVVKVTKNKLVYYQIVKTSPIFRELYTIVIGSSVDPISMFKEKVKKGYGDQVNVFIGKDKRKVFVISNHLKPDFLKTTCEEIKRATGIQLEALPVAPAQFKQMRSMGLIE